MKLSKKVVAAATALYAALAEANATDSITKVKGLRMVLTDGEPNIEFDVETTIKLKAGDADAQ